MNTVVSHVAHAALVVVAWKELALCSLRLGQIRCVRHDGRVEREREGADAARTLGADSPHVETPISIKRRYQSATTTPTSTQHGGRHGRRQHVRIAGGRDGKRGSEPADVVSRGRKTPHEELRTVGASRDENVRVRVERKAPHRGLVEIWTAEHEITSENTPQKHVASHAANDDVTLFVDDQGIDRVIVHAATARELFLEVPPSRDRKTLACSELLLARVRVVQRTSAHAADDPNFDVALDTRGDDLASLRMVRHGKDTTTRVELRLDVRIAAEIGTVELQAGLPVGSVDTDDVDLTLAQSADDGDDVFLRQRVIGSNATSMEERRETQGLESPRAPE